MKQLLIFLFSIQSCSSVQKAMSLELVRTAIDVSAKIVQHCLFSPKPFAECLLTWSPETETIFSNLCQRHHLTESEKRFLHDEIDHEFREIVRNEFPKD